MAKLVGTAQGECTLPLLNLRNIVRVARFFKSFLSLRSVDGEVENDLEDEDLGENLEKDVVSNKSSVVGKRLFFSSASASALSSSSSFE